MGSYTVYTSYKDAWSKDVEADSMKQAVVLAIYPYSVPNDSIHYTHGIGIQSQPAYYHVNGFGRVGVYHE